jgi:glycine cleavage system H protein
MFIPINLHYTSNHLWLRDIGRQDVYIGITDYAQKELGRIDSIEIQREGSLKKEEEAFGTIYGANKCVDLVMPFEGRILIINSDIETNPGILNSDPYHYWIVLLAATNNIEINSERYFTADKYKEAINNLKVLIK